MLAHHFRRRPTGFAVRWACLAIAYVLVCASGGPAGSATGRLAANAFSVNPSSQGVVKLSHRTATTPVVYPSLRGWHGSTGAWHLNEASRIVVGAGDAMVLRDTATTFQADLATESGRPVPVVISSRPRPGDVSLTRTPPDQRLGSEGYRLDIGDVLTVAAPTVTGVFYGTQTIEQILKADPHRSLVPRGTAADWPDFGERAQMLDVGRKFYPLSYLKSQIRTMAWEKLNTFHLHFSDWEGFRIQTDAFPGLASPESYSKRDLRELQDYARRYHVTIIPEIDLPAHAVAIAKYDPKLRFSCHSLDYSHWPGADQGGWVLNIASDYTRAFVRRLLDEIIPMFDGPYFHVGGDEYPYDADKAACPELVTYQKDHGFAYPGDVFVDFFNQLDRQVRSYGKTTEMWEWWNFNGQQTSIQPNKDIVIDSWVGNDPSALANQGYQVVGTPENTLYVSAGFGQHPGQYGYVNVQNVYENYPFTHTPGIIGYKVSRWSDRAEQEPPSWLDFFAHRPLQILAERLWGGPRSASVWQFFGRTDGIGDAPPTQLTAVPKAGMRVVSADSQETAAENGAAANAIDDNPYTNWNTAYSGGVAPLPHEIVLDLGRPYRLGGLRYLPRQDGGVNGRVSGYEVSFSDDGSHWKIAASGRFTDDQTEKEVDWSPAAARYVRLRALSEAGGGQLTSAAELTPLQAPAPDIRSR
jgi:hexosaminidase